MNRRIVFTVLCIVFACSFFCASAWAARVQQQSWNLARDMALGFTTNPFGVNYVGTSVNGRWFLMRNPSRDHIPAHFRKLVQYSDSFGVATRKAWTDSVSGTYIGMARQGDTLWPAFVPVIHPVSPSMATLAPFAIVGWKSPIEGSVNITGLITDIDAKSGNGVRWFVDTNSTTLVDGDISNGGAPQSFVLENVPVAKGQFVYFIIDAKSCYHYDDTTLDVVITLSSP